ncbi:MAG: 2-hydroxyacyl-CoA dehydratase family protein [Proteobacteria bacterium]|nr:2-hydroxyacyl-CoA dehydratase family protein [Pseudomonadota bacterium]MBU2228629.1 2-hydroxyacyl-CoA dehydratase family protein [Pseudomonadota bacterium]
MMFQFFQEMERGIEASIRRSEGQASPRKRYTLEVARLGRRLYSGEGKMAWCGIVAPFDLLSAMGVTSCFVEFVGAMLASTGMAREFIEAADHSGYSSDACSYHRSVMGAAIKDTMPVPDILVGTTNPCSGGLAVIENLSRHFSRPMFVLHVPQDESGGNVSYLADQIRRLARFVTDHTGLPLDRERLRRAIENTNRVHAIGSEVYRLAQHVPSPATSKDLSNFGIVMALFLGNDASVEVAEAYRDAFQNRIAEGKGGVPGEKIRLLWIQNRIQFRHPLEKMLEEQYGAAIVIDELNDFNWDPIDPDEPFEGLARRSISIPFNGTIERRVEVLRDLARRYKVHGAVNPCNWGCRQGTGARGLIEAGLREIGVPVLNLEVDCVDDRKFTEGQMRTRLEAFLEMLDGRPSAWT